MARRRLAVELLEDSYSDVQMFDADTARKRIVEATSSLDEASGLSTHWLNHPNLIGNVNSDLDK